jgi:predicted metal-dependent phosphoesterase TrpH
VAELQARSIGFFAIADHDAIGSVSTAEKLAREAGLAFLRGVEVSATLNSDLFHILVYGFDLEVPAMVELLRENKAKLERYNDDIVHLLIAAGYPIDFDDYATFEYDHTRGGWKVFNFLVERGFCTGVRDYFDDLIANITLDLPTFRHPAQVVAVAQEAGGAAVLAHPWVSLHHIGVTKETLRPFLDAGIAGLECYSQYHDEATTRFCLDWCARHDLLVTGGSDCHGGFVGRELGVPIIDIADLRLGELEERIIR